MMGKSLLFKAVLLLVLLSVVSAVIFLGPPAAFGGDGDGSQTFFEQFVIAGGPIVWFILLPMSAVTVFLAAEHGLIIRRRNLLPPHIKGTIGSIIRHKGLSALKADSVSGEDLLSVAVARAITGGAGDWFRIRNLLFESLQEQAFALGRRIEWVNLIGNVSPMVGLFGTVFGMIKLFNAIVVAGGQPQPAQLADGISVALVTTFWGLFIAIPALAIHWVFRNRIETILSDAAVQAEDIMSEMRLGLKKQHAAEVLGEKRPEPAVKDIAAQQAKTAGESVPLR